MFPCCKPKQTPGILHPEYLTKRSFLSPLWQSILLAIAAACQLFAAMAINGVDPSGELNKEWTAAGGGITGVLGIFATRIATQYQAPGARESDPQEGANDLQALLDALTGVQQFQSYITLQIAKTKYLHLVT